MIRRNRRPRRDDRGGLLPLIIVLITVMAFVMFSLASYATTGIMSASSGRSIREARAGARQAVDLALYQYGHDVWTPCTGVQALAVPTDLSAGLDVLQVNCAPTGTVGGHPVVQIASQAAVGSATVTYYAWIQVSVDGQGASLLWLEQT